MLNNFPLSCYQKSFKFVHVWYTYWSYNLSYQVTLTGGVSSSENQQNAGMIIFACIKVVKMFTSQDLLTEIANNRYIWFVYTHILFIVASQIPSLMGMGANATLVVFRTQMLKVWMIDLLW